MHRAAEAVLRQPKGTEMGLAYLRHSCGVRLSETPAAESDGEVRYGTVLRCHRTPAWPKPVRSAAKEEMWRIAVRVSQVTGSAANINTAHTDRVLDNLRIGASGRLDTEAPRVVGMPVYLQSMRRKNRSVVALSANLRLHRKVR